MVGVQVTGCLTAPSIHLHPFSAVRQRDPRTHMSRLDMDAYRPSPTVPQPPRPTPLWSSVGVGGLLLPPLADHGFDVMVLDKGRRVGGRASRRRVDDVVLTHGAPRADDWPAWMAAWAEVELEHERFAPADNGHALLDGPETIAGWLDGVDVLTSTTVTRPNRTTRHGSFTMKATDGRRR